MSDDNPNEGIDTPVADGPRDICLEELTDDVKAACERACGERLLIGEQDMRMIYNHVVRSSHFSKREKLDIHRSFNNIGISGLKMPR